MLLGNEAVVQGALEAGVNYVSVYPGTPSSEIGDIFSKIAKENGVYFEFSTNEKTAMESSIGASFAGLKCLVSMKSFGVNVASEAIIPFCYTGSKGAVVIMVADDPSCWSSGQSEQNTRAFSYSAHIPMIEPSDAQEAKDYIKLGFDISEKYNLPIIVRTTTRVAHQRMPVEIGLIKKSNKVGNFVKDFNRFVTMPPRVLEMKEELLAKIEKIREEAEKSSINILKKGQGKIGVITAGISYLHTKEVLEKLKLDVPILKLGFFYPLPKKKVSTFIKDLDRVLIIEELEGWLEKEVNVLAKENNLKLKVYGKDILPVSREFNVDIIGLAIGKVFGKKYKVTEEFKALTLPKRYPRLCQGCPYWFPFTAVKELAPKGTVFGGDIGCYMLAGFPPHDIQDYLLCMGSGIGIGHGIIKASQNKQKLVAFIGDSTFFHSGMPALVNAVYNKSNPLIIVMDNRITAMTGHQPNPGQVIKIEDIVKACGVKHIKVVDPQNVNELRATIKDFLTKKEVSVIVSKRICALWERRLKRLQK